MATVPRSPDSFTVAPTSLPGTRLTVPEYQDFGSAQMQRTGQAMTAAGGAAQKAAMEVADEVNKIRINDAMNKAVAARMRLTYDDADGFVNVKGERAVSWSKDKSLDQDYTERYQKEVDDIANSLGNEEQRKLFRMSVGQEINRFSGTVKQHLATELGNYEKGVRASTIELAQNKGAKEWENPESVSQSRRVIVNAIGSDASLSPEQRADQTIKALSPMHAAVVAAALEKNNTSYAREYLKQFDTELTEDARLRLHKAVDIGDNRVKAQTFGDEMLDSGKTQVEALAEARKRFTGAERDAAETRIKDIYGTLNAAKERNQSDAADTAWKYVAQGKPVPPSIMAALDGRDEFAIAKVMKDGIPVKTDVAKWLEFTNLPPATMAIITPQQLMREYRPYFSDSDLRNADQMIQAAKGLRGGKGSPDGLQLMTTQDLLKRTATELKILPAKGAPDEKEQARYLEFTDRMQLKVNQWEESSGKKASPEVLRKLLDEEKLNLVRYDEWGTDKDRPYFSMTKAQQEQAYVKVGDEEVKLSAIPMRRRAQIVEALQAKGQSVTEAEIARLWVKAGKPK